MPKKRYMQLAALLAALLALALLAGCGVNRALGAIMPAVPVAQTPSSSQVNQSGSDAHFVVLDDYFIMETPLGENPYVYASVGKMKAVATAQTNNQARFLRAMDNQSVLTQYYCKTRIANSADLTVGKEVYILDRTDSSGYHRAPLNAGEKNGSYWFKTKITDISRKAQGQVMVGGGLWVNINAVRVAVN